MTLADELKSIYETRQEGRTSQDWFRFKQDQLQPKAKSVK